MPKHAVCTSSIGGELQTVSPSASSSGESVDCPLPLQQMPPDQQTNLLYVQSRCFETGAFLVDSGARETAGDPFKWRISVSCGTWVPWMSAPLVF